MTKKILLGYEVGTGEPVEIQAHHLIVTGTTQLSGKTTTLEALVARGGFQAIAFRTKRGEASFTEGHRHTPFFRERADWQYVQSILEATMREKLRFERSWIIKVSKGAHTLRDVRDNVERELEKARGINEGVYTNLKAYLDIVIPELENHTFATELFLEPGINVMDLAGLREEVQGLVIASTIEAAHKHLKKTVTILPEAWKFIPEGRGSPVKLSVERLIREGAALQNYVWFDSQDITGVDKAPLKNVEVWILGRQREMNEIERTLKQIPVPKRERPKPEDVARLRLGHFYVCAGDKTRLVYVQPSWMDAETARSVALGDTALGVPVRLEVVEEPDMTKEEVERLTKQNERLEAQVRELMAASRRPVVAAAPRNPPPPSRPASQPANGSRLVQVGPISIAHVEREATITTSQETRVFNTTGCQGRIVYVLLKDLGNKPCGEGEIADAMREHGWNYPHQTMAPELAKMKKNGDLISDEQRPAKYRLPGLVKVRVDGA